MRGKLEQNPTAEGVRVAAPEGHRVPRNAPVGSPALQQRRFS